jgi:hypothetical protein
MAHECLAVEPGVAAEVGFRTRRSNLLRDVEPVQLRGRGGAYADASAEHDNGVRRRDRIGDNPALAYRTQRQRSMMTITTDGIITRLSRVAFANKVKHRSNAPTTSYNS